MREKGARTRAMTSQNRTEGSEGERERMRGASNCKGRKDKKTKERINDPERRL